MSKFVIENNVFRPIEEINLTKPGKYLIRKNSPEKIYDWCRTCLSRLEITEHTCTNGLGIFIDGHSTTFDLFNKNYEFVGPITIE